MRSALALIVLSLLGQGRLAAQSTPSADETAIRAVVAEFTRAFNSGDAKAVAALFTEQARIATERGKPVEGRSAIEKHFETLFEEEPGLVLAVKTESLRLLGSNAATEEGTATLEFPSSSDDVETHKEAWRYTAAYVKQDGKWLQDDLHDYSMSEPPVEKTARDHLKELEWLVGEWMDEDDDAEVRTTCEWSEGRSYILRSFKVRVGGKVEVSGVQRIGWDPRLKQFRSWVFDSEGGFSEALWSRDGDRDRWILKSNGVLKDGGSVSATNRLARIHNDALRWESVDRTLGNDALPDGEDVILVRRPPPPRPEASSTQPARKPK